jgi:hypothetical protein
MHYWRDFFDPFPVPIPKLGKFVAIWMLGEVLLPEQLFGYPCFAQFFIKIGKILF